MTLHLTLKGIKVLAPTSRAPSSLSSATPIITLHQALHHPNIVSILSAFTRFHETLYILELCSVGSLSDFLHSRPLPTLLESELRGVTKSLVDALTYLKKELVVHRNINLSSVLLTGDLGVVSFVFIFSVHCIRLTFSCRNYPVLNLLPAFSPPILRSRHFAVLQILPPRNYFSFLLCP